jgi:hypothetical protein
MRDTLLLGAYFDKSIALKLQVIPEMKKARGQPGPDPQYDAQYAYNIVRRYYELILGKYSRGDPIAELPPYLPELVEAWEVARRMELAVFPAEMMNSRTNFEANLSHYTVCFWLVGLALAFEVDDALWYRLLALVGNEGRDRLFDRVVATRQPGRPIGEKLLYPKPYQPLLDALDAEPKKQATLLHKFVKNWYAGLKRAQWQKPYWHDCHLGQEFGGYFGYWCVEAVAAVKACHLDDRGLLELVHYPEDLLVRPTGTPDAPN